MAELRANLLDLSSGESPIDRLTLLCDGAETLSLAVGYLFLEGLGPLLPKLMPLKKIRLLMGNVVNLLTEEQIQEGKVNHRGAPSEEPDEMFARGLREERDRSAIETALNLRQTIDSMPRTEDNRRIIIDVATLIAQGTMQVRVLTSRRLHAKAACVSYPSGDLRAPGAAIVGSSNLTLAASRVGRKERSRWSADLDVHVEGRENLAFLNDWFGAHWAEAQDFQKELFEELGRAWPLLPTVQ